MVRENEMHERLVGSGVWKCIMKKRELQVSRRCWVRQSCIRGLGVSPAQAIVWRLMITYLVIYLDGFQWQKFRYNRGRVGKSYGERRLYPWFSGKSSDIILVELENRMVKEDDRADLLEDGVLQAASPASHSSSITSPVVRLFTMDESFLLENR
ncbi:hypothetical protein Tco_0443138 [Tanacetum coccineum]